MKDIQQMEPVMKQKMKEIVLKQFSLLGKKKVIGKRKMENNVSSENTSES